MPNAWVEDHGLFGSISAVPSILITSFTDDGPTGVTVNWTGGVSPYLVQRLSSLGGTNWTDLLTTPNTTAKLPKDGTTSFFRVRDHAN